MAEELDHIHLHVQDLEATQKALEAVLGTTVVKHFFSGTKEILQLDFGGIKLSLSPAAADRPVGIDHLGIRTDRLDQLVDRFTEQGYTPVTDVMQSATSRIRFIRSPEGITFEILEPVAGRGA
ncbi:MAG: VOC family protein [Actinomycetia bacterium]|jgi:catechol 2,3-dioxygenase-like lactoylglutathione lyase family enzyme|nr:VOC family protein [Actinomycetes bacterium]